ncbi:MAG: hypothetical protein AB8B64_09225 [Granulosicoccus sp.]
MDHTLNQSPGHVPEASSANTPGNLGRLMTTALLALSSLAWFIYPSTTRASEVFGGLNQGQQAAITLNCTPLQFTQGSAAYRDCLRAELAAAQETAGPDAGALTVLSIDEQYAIQRVCITDITTLSTDYASCAREQLRDMIQEPEPAIAQIPDDEQFVISQQCFETQSNAGARAFRQCINTALASLEALPAADFTSRTSLERSNIQLECSISSGNASTYRKCLLNALGIDYEPEILPAPQTEPVNVNNTAASSDDASSDNMSLAEDEPDLPVATADQTTRSEFPETTESVDPTINSAPSTLSAGGNAQSIQEAISIIAIKTKAALLKLTPTHWIALLAALTLPLMFFIVKSARKPASRRPVRSTISHSHDKYVERQPDPHDTVLRPAAHTSNKPDLAAPAKYINSPRADDSISLDETFLVDVQTLTDDLELENEDQTVLASKPQAASKPEPEPEAVTRLAPKLDPEPMAATMISPKRVPEARRPAADNSVFIEWLADFPAIEQQEYAIEFLVYWMAYADNRFDPTLRKQVFQMKNPDIRTLIKRWVFKKDAIAFADAIGYLQAHTSAAQRRQIIDLLMALLVTEKALTPVQNNLLRFLADAFGIYNAGLNELFIRAYGHTMPVIPRPDKTLWWSQLSAEQKLRWDARAVARQPDHIRYRIALGQPLNGELNPKSVERSFKLAMRRCQHERVNDLGEREMILIETQRKKFETAYEALLEPIT